jgi:hypothetical protein
MRTKNSSDFSDFLQRYVFICPDADINPDTNLPYNEKDYCVVDVDDLSSFGCPTNKDGADMDFWAILQPGEEID